MNRQQFLKRILADFVFSRRPCPPCAGTSSIPLCSCAVAGFQYYDGLRCIQTLRPGDRLELVREPDNPYDDKAIAIHAPHDGQLGYLPRRLNEIPAALLDHRKKLQAFIKHVDPAAPPWEMLEIMVVMS